MISYYELLGMIKEDKTPKKIRVHLTPNTSKIYIRHIDIDEEFSYYGLLNEDEENEEYKYYLSECLLESSMFEKNIEIIEEEKKIPEKIEEFGLIQYNLDYIDYKNIETLKEWLNKDFQTIYDTIDLIIKNQNKLIDYLKSKGE